MAKAVDASVSVQDGTVDALKKELYAVRMELAASKAECTTQEAHLAEMKEALAACNMQHKADTATTTQLEEELSAIKVELQEATDGAAAAEEQAIADTRATAATQSQEMRALQAKLDELQSSGSRCAELQAELCAVRDELLQLREPHSRYTSMALPLLFLISLGALLSAYRVTLVPREEKIML